jgi:hypothetical protein
MTIADSAVSVTRKRLKRPPQLASYRPKCTLAKLHRLKAKVDLLSREKNERRHAEAHSRGIGKVARMGSPSGLRLAVPTCDLLMRWSFLVLRRQNRENRLARSQRSRGGPAAPSLYRTGRSYGKVEDDRQGELVSGAKPPIHSATTVSDLLHARAVSESGYVCGREPAIASELLGFQFLTHWTHLDHALPFCTVRNSEVSAFGTGALLPRHTVGRRYGMIFEVLEFG